jgi:hypothetical protein
MVENYLSAVYDLTPFGIFKIRSAIVSADVDDGITIEVSFNGGSTFYRIEKLNTKFTVPMSTGKIQVRITFEDQKSSDIYMVKSTGFFQNLNVGTNVNFTKTTTNKNFQTSVGREGYYSIRLPRGNYEVWYTNSGTREILMRNYNPEVVYTPTQRTDKEAMIESAFSGIDWAKWSVFDTFVDRSKMIYGGAIIDPEGDLSDGVTNRKCRYWAVGFE